MISVRLSQVPEYLREGEFYQSLDLSSDDEIQVPRNALKPNTNIWVDSQLFDYLVSLRYWGVADVSKECVEFVVLRDQHCLVALHEFDGNFPTLTLVNELLRKPNKDERFRVAVQRDAIEVVKCMSSLGYPLIDGACDIAAKLPTSAMLTFLHTKKTPISISTLKIALSSGNIDAVRYLERQNLRMQDHIAEMQVIVDGRGFVIVGNLACFVYAIEHGCVMSTYSLRQFAARNMLDIVQYMHQHNCLWDEEVTIAAAKHGALECLKYAHEHGCPTTVHAYHTARAARQHTCVAYLQEKGIHA